MKIFFNLPSFLHLGTFALNGTYFLGKIACIANLWILPSLKYSPGPIWPVAVVRAKTLKSLGLF